MSLIDALLLEPYPFEVWISYRTDGIKGSGTLNDPYDGSGAHFDEIMNEIISAAPADGPSWAQDGMTQDFPPELIWPASRMRRNTRCAA